MTKQEMLFVGIAATAMGAVLYMMARPVQIDIAPRPSAPLPNDVVGESEGAPDNTPSISRYSGMFLYPLSFARAMPITSTRMQ